MHVNRYTWYLWHNDDGHEDDEDDNENEDNDDDDEHDNYDVDDNDDDYSCNSVNFQAMTSRFCIELDLDNTYEMMMMEMTIKI